MKLRSLAIGLVLSAALPVQSVLAGGHGGAPISNVDELPVRSGDWSPEELAKGRRQLIAAFDAAWVRVVATGKDREVLATQPPNRPGASKSYIVRLADCLPEPEYTPWPENPVGPFKDILETGVIRQLVQGVPETPANTSYYFSGISQGFQAAVLAEIEKHYGVELKVETVVLAPGKLPATSLLVAGKVDFLSQLNATGGHTEGLRRRDSRRFSCTMTASSQFIHIPEKSPLAREINSFDDLAARPHVRICAGPLATQTSSAFLPQHSITTKFVNDLSDCDAEIKEGKFDVIINPMHDLSIAGLKGYKSVHTLLATGTPLWVADEGIECRTVGEGRAAESICTVVDPL
ncbi:MAG: transporter substrate-binding domain-containing protein [Chromatiales bacterium]|nr:transporter substrate-binding domain-containing protein [Chromatiales bacterium]